MQLEGDITHTLQEIQAGEPDAEAKLVDMVYEQLRRIAHRRLAGERYGHTWQTTDLVHEWVRASGASRALQHVTNRRHLINAVSRAMLNLLISHARARRQQKRGGGQSTVALDQVLDAIECYGTDIVELYDALGLLRQEYPRQAAVFEQHVVGGFGTDELAAIHGVSQRTIQADIRFAKAKLRSMLGDS